MIDVNRFITIPNDAKPDLRHQCRTENMGVIEAGTLVARRPTALKAAVMRPSIDPPVRPIKAGIKYRGPLEAITHKESIFGRSHIVDLDVELIDRLTLRRGLLKIGRQARTRGSRNKAENLCRNRTYTAAWYLIAF